MAADKEERRATTLAAGLEWESDEESDEAAQVRFQPSNISSLQILL